MRASTAFGAIFDQVRQGLDEFAGALATEVIRLRQREDLLELVEDQHGISVRPAASCRVSSRWSRIPQALPATATPLWSTSPEA